MSQTGTVKFFDVEKGFGFITPDNGGLDIFIHISTLQIFGLTELLNKQKVTYEVTENINGKGLKATKISLLDEVN
ncbi:cold-shock protein [Bartonella sp. DGB1]|uniref:cold-shock protein n=1 Tax=Bartonella sp. DGB1 TaxID=3239807 RepID=UPI003525FB6A